MARCRGDVPFKYSAGRGMNRTPVELADSIAFTSNDDGITLRMLGPITTSQLLCVLSAIRSLRLSAALWYAQPEGALLHHRSSYVLRTRGHEGMYEVLDELVLQPEATSRCSACLDPLGWRQKSPLPGVAAGRSRRAERGYLAGSRGVSSSNGATSRAAASRSKLSREMFRAHRSTCATKVRCNPASNASASCDHPRSRRNRIRFSASTARAGAELLAGEVRPGLISPSLSRCCFYVSRV